MYVQMFNIYVDYSVKKNNNKLLQTNNYLKFSKGFKLKKQI